MLLADAAFKGLGRSARSATEDRSDVMQFLPNVSRRCNRRELMDEPQLPKNRLIEALRGLERINWWSGSAGILWPPIRTLARESSYRPLRLLDVASGAGDLPIRLWRKARRADIN